MANPDLHENFFPLYTLVVSHFFLCAEAKSLFVILEPNRTELFP